MPDEPLPVPQGAKIHLSSEEAIILFELLSRWCGDTSAATPEAFCFQSTAEGAVLHKLLAGLEGQLVTPFGPDYAEFLSEARSRLEDSWPHSTLRG